MANDNDLMVSASDAEALAVLLAERRRGGGSEADAADALADLLVDARTVAPDRLPGDRVAMNSLVAYREDPGGGQRRVALVHPGAADASAGRISVLSPVGRALLGRKRGAVTTLRVPGGRALTLRVLEVAPAA